MLTIREQVPLAPLTTLGVGGPARHFAEAHTAAEVIAALDWAEQRSLSVVVLGGGSNLLVSDRGIDALVLRVRTSGIAHALEGGGVTVQVGAGQPWDSVVSHAVAEGWAGLECLSGIPGDTGATPIQNVGAYGQEVSETISRVHAVERRSKTLVTLGPEDCELGYRDSIFKREAAGRYIIVRVDFRLHKGGAPSIRYPELARHLRQAGASGAPDLATVRRGVLELRRRKSMVLDARDENGKSAGSFFMNPTFDREALKDVLSQIERAGVLGSEETIPQFPAASDRVKLSAAWLIEKAGFTKGTHVGHVGLSTRHALAIVNRGGATASEIVDFARRVRTAVRDRFGVALSPEPVLMGFEPGEVDDLRGR